MKVTNQVLPTNIQIAAETTAKITTLEPYYPINTCTSLNSIRMFKRTDPEMYEFLHGDKSPWLVLSETVP